MTATDSCDAAAAANICSAVSVQRWRFGNPVSVSK